MSTLTIHGWEIEAADISRSEELVQGAFRRAASARLNHSRQASKRAWVVKTPVQDPDVAEVLRALVNGKGDVWSFDADVYSSKGRAFSSVPARDTTNFKFGVASMTASSGNTFTSTWTEDTLRTVLLWRRAGSGSFNHYALVCDGASVTAKYKNGSTTAETVTNWFTPSADGSFALLGKNDSGTNTTVQYDDVVVIVGEAPAEAITAWAAATEAWADIPTLRVSGDLIARSDSVQVIPAYKGSSYVQGVSPVSGTFVSNLEALSFDLREV
jgi:hypothetical protein